ANCYVHQSGIPDPPGLVKDERPAKPLNISRPIIWARMKMGGVDGKAHLTFVSKEQQSIIVPDVQALRRIIENEVLVVNSPRGYGNTTQAPFMAMECADMWRAAHSVKKDGCYKDPRSSYKFIIVVDSPNAAISLQEYYMKMYPSMRIGVALDDLGLCKDDFVGTMQGQTEKVQV
ncbi:hypothetical protein PFISCL1PPCAC_20400, partial [Pristionchus fissidentatus]